MGDMSITEIAGERVHAYIAGSGPVTRYWHRKYEVLRGFYRFAMARGYLSSFPLPKVVPKPPEFVPHIFSHEELQRLLDASHFCENPRCKLRPYTWRMLILLLYGAALRISEALSLTLADVDLTAGVLTIREKQILQDAAGTNECGPHRCIEGVCGTARQGTWNANGGSSVSDSTRSAAPAVHG
jgi:site-specific recombinase XerD